MSLTLTPSIQIREFEGKLCERQRYSLFREWMVASIFLENGLEQLQHPLKAPNIPNIDASTPGRSCQSERERGRGKINELHGYANWSISFEREHKEKRPTFHKSSTEIFLPIFTIVSKMPKLKNMHIYEEKGGNRGSRGAGELFVLEGKKI